MQSFDFSSSSPSRPITINASTEAQVYGLTAVAMALTVVGAFFGIQYAPAILTSGMHIFLIIAELAIIFTAGWWMNKSPLNYLLFGLFPTLSGFTIAPYLLSVAAGYANGPSILLNAGVATVFMTLASAVFARTTSWNLAGLGRGLFFAVLGLIGMGILQIFMPSLRTGPFELMISGAGIVIFAAFLTYDLQRIQQMGKAGANPFLMALSLYLDIFNLFLFILRFMVAFSGDRR